MDMERARLFFEQGREYLFHEKYKDAIAYLEAAAKAGYPQLDSMICHAKEKAAQQEEQDSEHQKKRAYYYHDKGNEMYTQGYYADALVYYDQAEREGLSTSNDRYEFILQKLRAEKHT